MAMAPPPKACVTEVSGKIFGYAYRDGIFSMSYLPVLFAEAKLTSLEKITEEQLESFVPFMIRCSLNDPRNLMSSKVKSIEQFVDVFSCRKPQWWFRDLPFAYPIKPTAMWRNKFAVLKSLVCRCYTYYNSEYMLRISAELAALSPKDLYFQDNIDATITVYSKRGDMLIRFWKGNLLYDWSPLAVLSDSEDESSDDSAAKVSSNGDSSKMIDNKQASTSKENLSEIGAVAGPSYSHIQARKHKIESEEYKQKLHKEQMQNLSVVLTPLATKECKKYLQPKKIANDRKRVNKSELRIRKKCEKKSETDMLYTVKNMVKKRKSNAKRRLPLHKNKSESLCSSNRKLHLQRESSKSGVNEKINFLLNLKIQSKVNTVNRSTSNKNITKVDSLKTKRTVIKMRQGSMFLSKHQQSRIFNKVPFSSDLGKEYLLNMRPFVCTQRHLDRIEKCVYKNNVDHSTRHIDMMSSYNSGNCASSNSISPEEPFCSNSRDINERFYKFCRCRMCKLGQHNNKMQSSPDVSDFKESKLYSCYVKLSPLPKRVLDALAHHRKVSQWSRTGMPVATGQSSDRPINDSGSNVKCTSCKAVIEYPTSSNSNKPSINSLDFCGKSIDVVDLTADDSCEEESVESAAENVYHETKFIPYLYVKNFHNEPNNQNCFNVNKNDINLHGSVELPFPELLKKEDIKIINKRSKQSLCQDLKPSANPDFQHNNISESPKNDTSFKHSHHDDVNENYYINNNNNSSLSYFSETNHKTNSHSKNDSVVSKIDCGTGHVFSYNDSCVNISQSSLTSLKDYMKHNVHKNASSCASSTLKNKSESVSNLLGNDENRCCPSSTTETHSTEIPIVVCNGKNNIQTRAKSCQNKKNDSSLQQKILTEQNYNIRSTRNS